jgi:hypothetical protein
MEQYKLKGVCRRRYNKKLYSLFNDVDIIKINIIKWEGRVMRRVNEEIIKKIMLVKPEGKRKKGRARMRWQDDVEKDLRNLGVFN